MTAESRRAGVSAERVAAVLAEVENYLIESRNALRAANTIGMRSCRDGDNIAEADRIRATLAAQPTADRSDQ